MLTFEDIRNVGDRNYPMRWRMVSVNKPSQETVLIYKELKFDSNIPARIFTQQNLKRRF